MPILFYTPSVLYSIWQHGNVDYSEEPEFQNLDLLDNLISYALILIAYLVHEYIVNKDIATITIEKIMISRQ